MAQPSVSRDLCFDEIVHILEEPIDENVNINDSGSEIDSDEDDSDGDKFSECSENEDISESDSEEQRSARPKRSRIDSQWKWSEVDDSYVSEKIQFSGSKGPVHHVSSVTEAFKLFFDQAIMEKITEETNHYAKNFINSKKGQIKRRSRIHTWEEVDVDELYVFFALQMLMGIVQKPSLKSYFTKNPLLDTPIFYKTMTQDRFELLNKFIHFVNNDEIATYQGNKKLFKISPIVNHLNTTYKVVYNMDENISLDESLTLWKGRLGIKTYLPLKAAKFGIKSYEVCESSTGYLWQFIIYSGKTTESGSEIVPADSAKTTQLVVKLVEPLFNLGHTLWMDNYYNSPELCHLLKQHKVNVAGTLRLNRKNVPATIKQTKLSKGELVAYHSQGIMVLKWLDKKPVSFISTFHNASMVSTEKRGKVINKPQCIWEYNRHMGGVDMKDQKLQPYLLERKRCAKWYLKLFRRLLNTSVHNALIVYSMNKDLKSLKHFEFRLQLVRELLETHVKTVQSPHAGRPSKTPAPERLVARHFIEKIPPTQNKTNPTRRCVVCSNRHKKRKETVYWCKDCGIGLCFNDCFKIYHTEAKL